MKLRLCFVGGRKKQMGGKGKFVGATLVFVDQPLDRMSRLLYVRSCTIGTHSTDFNVELRLFPALSTSATSDRYC